MNVTVHAPDLVAEQLQITLTLTGCTKLRARLLVARWFIALASWVLRAPIKLVQP